jgi:hypothetical protein
MVETPQQHVMALPSRWVRGLDVIRDRPGSGPAFCTVVTARARTGAVVGSKRRTAHGARRIATSRRTARRTAHGPSESERRGFVGGGGGRPGRAVVAPSSCRDVVVVVAIAPCGTPVTTQAAAAASATHGARRTAAAAEVGE